VVEVAAGRLDSQMLGSERPSYFWMLGLKLSR
jgi:hypothetical protein